VEVLQCLVTVVVSGVVSERAVKGQKKNASIRKAKTK
jgi:hypothetical protein